MPRTALEGLGGKLHPTDEVVIEAIGNSMAMSRGPLVVRAAGRDRQSAAGEGDRACSRENRQVDAGTRWRTWLRPDF
jgi:hypothetical protein